MNISHFSGRFVAALKLASALAGLGACIAAQAGPAFVPSGEPAQATVYIYREAKATSAGIMPLSEQPAITVNGTPQGLLGWGTHRRVVVPPGDIAIVAGEGEGARWAFGKTGYYFAAAAGSVTYLRLEILEKMPDELSPTVVRRNWVSRFRETTEDEAGKHLAGNTAR